MSLSGLPPRQKPAKAPRDPERLARIKQLPCAVCNAPPPSDAHHCIHDRYSQAKAPDSMTIPLCKACHQDGPDAIHNDKAAWRAKHGPDHGYLAMVDDMLGEWF